MAKKNLWQLIEITSETLTKEQDVTGSKAPNQNIVTIDIL
jgi:hypothetical protein